MKKLYYGLILVLTCLFFSGCVDDQNNELFEYDEISLNITSNEDYLLASELILPKTDDKVPAVVIVPGSGPMDMDGTTNSQKPYKELAINLAKKGIASIRFNKVSYQFLANVANEYSFTIEDEYLDTIEGAIEILKERSEIDSSKIYLVGHSLGSQIIPLVLNNDETLAGGIIMAGTTMHLLDLLLEQINKQSEEMYNQYKPYCDYLKGLSEVPKGEEKLIYFGAYTAYYVNYNKLDRELVKDLDCPLLIMQGELDIQVSMEHFYNYKELLKDNENVEYKQYETLNHLFSDGTGEDINSAYKINNSISDEVVEDICNFINNK